MITSRQELLRLLAEMSDAHSELRMGQMIANLATLARGAQVEAIWDSENDELIAAARRLLEHYRQRSASVA
jgi:hypothetical protein